MLGAGCIFSLSCVVRFLSGGFLGEFGYSAGCHSVATMRLVRCDPRYGKLFRPGAMTVAVILGIHTGLWFFHRWARLLFVFWILVSAWFTVLFFFSSITPLFVVLGSPPFLRFVFRPIGVHFWGMLNGVFISFAMSFLPPVPADRFKLRSNPYEGGQR